MIRVMERALVYLPGRRMTKSDPAVALGKKDE